MWMMRKLVILSALSLTLASTAFATPATINDNYVGGTPTVSGYYGVDIVGSASLFDIDHMTVDISSGTLSIEINTSYFDNVGSLRTEFGDLFISSDGWSPYGAANYNDDDYSNGESWEYVIKLDNHGEAYSSNNTGYSMIGESGNADLFEIQDSSEIELSSANSGHRAGQEVQFNPLQGNNSLASGNWFIGDLTQGYSNLLITLSLIGTPLEFISDFGFHWAFTCGNDVIEGAYNKEVPEPASMALLGLGLGALGARRRRKRV